MTDPVGVVLKPSRLAVFALDRASGRPIAQLPVYAEIIWQVVEPAPPAPPPDTRFEEVSVNALIQADQRCEQSGACRVGVVAAIAAALGAVLTSDARDQLQRGIPEPTNDLFIEIIRGALDTVGAETLDGVPTDRLVAAIETSVRAVARVHALNMNTPLESVARTLATHPLGVLATDSGGYASFDLLRLPSPVLDAVKASMRLLRAGGPQPNADADPALSIWVYPFGEEGRFDAFAQLRFAHDAIVMRLEIDAPLIPEEVRNLGLLAMQNPSLTDWRLSPSSFATNPGALVGADGCETLLPANTAVADFNFYQVIGVSDASAQPPRGGPLRVALVNEHRLSWVPIGHALGQILYSCPLAPGESVRLAVIDWTRRDSALRTETTKLDESLVHELRRDRTISETVRASVQEMQHGNSFIAGVAGSVGGAMGGSGMGAAAGIAGSLGGATSTSTGSRVIAADTVQKLSDQVAQASAASRELYSTVVVESAQSEHEAIETRSIANYNHSHTLTILYYEILRQFRLVSEFVRRRAAVLVPLKTDWFTLEPPKTDPPTTIRTSQNVLQHIVEYRAVLEAALLDRKLLDGFDAVERLSRYREGDLADLSNDLPGRPTSPPPPPPPPAGPAFTFFEFEMTVGGMSRDIGASDERVDVLCTLLGPGQPVGLVNMNGSTSLNPFGAFRETGRTNTFWATPSGGVAKSVLWGDITAIALTIAVYPSDRDQAGVSFSHIKLTATGEAGPVGGITLVDQPYENGHLIIKAFGDDSNHGEWELHRGIILPTLRPPPAPLPGPFYAPQDEADHARARALIAHLTYHKSFYARAILFDQDAAERATQLQSITVSGALTALDYVENRPLELLGDFVAYPCADPTWSSTILSSLEARVAIEDPPPVERLVTLPSPGVFAEARLGHCNASEEIDNTRFWDWQQSPIPLPAAEIAPIQGVTPGPEKPEGLAPTPFPTSLVNIVNPPNAPDPTGMAAALTALATPNIFRDMSGRAEVADLLKKLSDNSVAIAQAAQAAASGGTRTPGSGTSGASSVGSGTTSGGGGTGGPRATPTQPSATNRDLQDLQHVLGRAQDNNLIAPQAAQDLFTQAAQDAYDPKLRLGFAVDAGAVDAGAGGTPPVAAFPPAVDNPLAGDGKFQSALDKAIAALEDKRSLMRGTLPLRFSFVDVTAGGTSLPSAHHLELEMDYVASSIKVAVMYAAFALRDMASRYATQTGTATSAALFAGLVAQMNGSIKAAVPQIASAANINDRQRLPDYPSVLSATPSADGLDVQFTSAFKAALRGMIVPSNNNDAATCIHGVGYGYLNGALAAGGFLDLGEPINGLWVAGDFQTEKVWPYVRIPVSNDGPTAMNGTTSHMARLVSLILTKRILNPAACDEMLELLRQAVVANDRDQPWIDRPQPRVLRAGCIMYNKLGLGPLQDRRQVRSEISVLAAPLKAGKRYVVAWQNLTGLAPVGFADVATLIRDTIADFEL